MLLISVVLIAVCILSIVEVLYLVDAGAVAVETRQIARNSYNTIKNHGAFNKEATEIYYDGVKQLSRSPFLLYGCQIVVAFIFYLSSSALFRLHTGDVVDDMYYWLVAATTPLLFIIPNIVIFDLRKSKANMFVIKSLLHSVEIYDNMIKQVGKSKK